MSAASMGRQSGADADESLLRALFSESACHSVIN